MNAIISINVLFKSSCFESLSYEHPFEEGIVSITCSTTTLCRVIIHFKCNHGNTVVVSSIRNTRLVSTTY